MNHPRAHSHVWSATSVVGTPRCTSLLLGGNVSVLGRRKRTSASAWVPCRCGSISRHVIDGLSASHRRHIRLQSKVPTEPSSPVQRRHPTFGSRTYVLPPASTVTAAVRSWPGAMPSDAAVGTDGASPRRLQPPINAARNKLKHKPLPRLSPQQYLDSFMTDVDKNTHDHAQFTDSLLP